MRRTIITLMAIAFVLIVIPSLTEAQSAGCCCDPVVKNGSFMTAADCASLGFMFIGPPPSVGVTCSDHCGATLLPTPGATCGDLICQSSETATSCPADCGQIITGCGSPAYKPAPSKFNVTAVKGQKALKLTYNLACQADYLNISRCKGTDCTNFAKVAEIPAQTVFIDEDDSLEFDTDYTYSITAHYTVSGDSDPAIAIGNAGDIECWGQTSSTFCVNYFSYDQYAGYLKRFGYGGTTPSEFTASFGYKVNTTFATRLNQAWKCNDINKLIDPSPKTICDSKKNEYCIADELGARCARREPCDVGFDPFGLLGNTQNCEKGLLSRYCFFDKSWTAINKCFSCDPRMTCYDYKSKNACERDNCGAGDCQWNPTFEDLGAGVCADRRYNNCKLCNSTGTTGMENLNASSPLWDACREEKSTALSTLSYPCFYDKDRRISKTCDEASCADYTQTQCGSPVDGIKLNPDNSVAAKSTDTCGIGVCQYTPQTGCIKNADGNTGAGFQDCKVENKTCEMDYFPPVTALIPSGQANRIDKIDIRIFDKINKTSPPADYAGKQGYKTYLCLQNSTTSCNDAKAFPISVNTTQLLLKNTHLKLGNKTIAKLNTGNNTLVYYSKDAANNVEVINEIDLYACDNCTGPTLLSINVTGGRIIGKTIFTSAVRPTFTLTFDEPTAVSYADISRTGEAVSLTQTNQGLVESHQFTPIADLNGEYNFTVNGHNTKNIYMNYPVSYLLVVDPTIAGVTITPPDGAVLNKTIVDVEINFTKPASLDKITIGADNFDDPYAPKETSRDITNAFKTTNNQSFDGKVDKLGAGRNTITVDATGFNNLDIYKQSSFFVATGKPGIRLRQPSFGVTGYYVYNITIETPIASACKYAYDMPEAPSSADFDFLNLLEGTNTLHTASGLNIPAGANRAYPLHVYCDFDNFGIIQRTFNITLDDEPPVIVKAFAEPSVIAEQYIPGQELYSTTLKVQMSKPGFCKYSLLTSNFNAMERTFPGYEFLPKQSLSAEVNVTQKQSYEYWVACKGKNQLLSEPVKIPFTIDLTLPLNVTSSTPQGFGTLDFTLGVVSNKRVFCYFGERADDTTRCMGACRSGYTQAQNITVDQPGEYLYFVRCAHVNGEQSEILEIPVIIDTTPPTMTEVGDDSNLVDSPELWWSQNKARVRFMGEDEESGISHYLITLKSKAGQTVFKDYVSNVTNGEYIFISKTNNGSSFRLNNNKEYYFSVKAVSRVGLESEPMDTDGFMVDTGKIPGQCLDGDQNGNETDVDCGEGCEGCAEGKKCGYNDDCATGYCDAGICKVASCEDNVKNGLEAGVDCGGQVEDCPRCENGQDCIVHTDCASGYCDILEKICTDAPPCADKTMSPGESDVDCGGPCDKCTEGKGCTENLDCLEGLHCKPDTKTCTSEPAGDEDADGVTDDKDSCFGTPSSEAVNEEGCGASQTYSLGDEIDDRWRQDHFGCIDCPEAAADADPDKDTLTNIEEYRANTNPTKKDTDGDRWKDNVELEKGTDPTDRESHPPNTFSNTLWTLFILIAVAGIAYGGYTLLKKPAAEKEYKAPKREEKPAPEIVKDEISKLRAFAKEEEVPDKDWIQLERAIKKKPLPPKKFHEALERLKKIAHEEKISPEAPLMKLRAMLDELGAEERQDILAKYKLLQAGLLSKEEIEELLRRLKITAEYYGTHKEELQKELEQYGKRKKRQ